MPHEDDEPNYLAETQLAVDPKSFKEIVREVYWLEHRCVENQEIAHVLGVDKSRISQIFGDPPSLKASSVRNLTDHLASPQHRQAIVDAWTRECFGDLKSPDDDELLVGAVDEKTIEAIDRQVRQQRLTTAANVTLDALKRECDPTIRELLLDRAQFLYRRLDRPGSAMTFAYRVSTRATDSGDLHRLAAANVMRIKILVGLPDCLPSEIIPIFEATMQLLGVAGKIPDPSPPYYLPNIEEVQELHNGVVVTLMERRLLKRSEDELRKVLEKTLAATESRNTYQKLSRAHQLASRIYLLLGDTFQAEEHLQKSFAAGGLKNLNILEANGLIEARIKLETEGAKEAAMHLHGVIKQCRTSRSQYHRRLAEYDLARVQSCRFPPSRPVV